MCPLSNIVSQIFENFNKQMQRKDVDVYIWLLSEYFHWLSLVEMTNTEFFENQ